MNLSKTKKLAVTALMLAMAIILFAATPAWAIGDCPTTCRNEGCGDQGAYCLTLSFGNFCQCQACNLDHPECCMACP